MDREESDIESDTMLRAGPAPAEDFRENVGSEPSDELIQGRRTLIVAESVDASTDRTATYMADVEVPIDVAAVQHFEDANGRRLMAKVHLMEPESVQPRASRTSTKSACRTVNGLQYLAGEKDISEIYKRLKDGVRGISLAQGYKETEEYIRKLENGEVRALMQWPTREVGADPPEGVSVSREMILTDERSWASGRFRFAQGDAKFHNRPTYGVE